MKLLIVLLGTNPLPVYVTIKAVSQEATLGFDQLLVVYSEHTKKYRCYLKKALSLEESMITDCNLESDQRRPQVIKNRLTKALSDLSPAPTEIHYNHTGGTKTMAIHGFKAIAEFAVNKRIPLIISDLDPDCHKLNLTQNGETSMYPDSSNYLSSIQCDIEFLTGLHGFTTKIRGQATIADTYLGIQLQDFFAEVLADAHLTSFPKSVFHDKWSAVRDLKKIKDNHSKLPAHLEKRHGLDNKGKVLDFFYLNTFTTITPMSNPPFFANLYGILDFVDGKWLEYLVFTRVQALIEAKKITADQVLHSHKVQLGDTAANRDCELDVVIMKGYQLTLISCTTSIPFL